MIITHLAVIVTMITFEATRYFGSCTAFLIIPSLLYAKMLKNSTIMDWPEATYYLIILFTLINEMSIHVRWWKLEHC